MRRTYFWVLVISLVYFGGCQPDAPSSTQTEKAQQVLPAKKGKINVSQSYFGQTADGPADLYTLSNEQGMEVKITNFGGIITSIKVPDKAGYMGDVVLGFDSLSGYVGEHPYFGAIIGRYGNRIAKGQFSLGDTKYTLAKNNDQNHLHGGVKGFDKVLWKATTVEDGIALDYTSPHLEEGYPGNLKVKVTYQLTNNNELKISYEATTDQTTLCNLTNHTYFNLAGKGAILDHRLMIKADWYTPINKGLIPTGKLEGVKGTPFNFRKPKAIGQDIEVAHEQLKYGLGYDHNFVLNMKPRALTLAAIVSEPTSGRMMEVWTEEPGIQFYTGNFLDGSITGKKGVKYAQRSGFCLETQHFPDSPNQSLFPSTYLEPGDIYQTKTVYKFFVK